MIYITFDTNIWVYLLSESWGSENALDYLEHWIDTEQIAILLPEIIRDEWAKHRVIQPKKRKEQLKEFFDLADQILPTEFFKEYSTASAIDKIIDQQLERIDAIVNKAQWIPLSESVQSRIITDGVARKAPLHKKSSVADAIIIYSLFEYAKAQANNKYFFVSNNTDDFCQKEKGRYVIHEHLKPEFNNLGIDYYKEFNRLKYDLSTKCNLTLEDDSISRKRQGLKNKIKSQIYNPHYESLATGVSELFSQNKKMLDFILEEDVPTKEQVIVVLSLIDSDEGYERYFYGKVRGKVWFNILHQKGIFKYKNNPENNGHWNPLLFLLRLANEEREHDIIQSILDFISNVSEKSNTNNINTWYYFIQILTTIPSKYIPIEIFKYVPKWISGENRYSSVVREICSKLIPKLYNETPKRENKKKIECIVKHFLSMSLDQEKQKDDFSFDSKYSTHLDNLMRIFDEELITIIADSCAKETILLLIDKLKFIYYDYPSGVSFSIKKETEKLRVKLAINIDKNEIEVFSENGESFLIQKFDRKTQSSLNKALASNLVKQGFDIDSENNEHFDYTVQSLINGRSYMFGSYGVEEYRSNHNNHRVEIAFVAILLRLLNEYIKKQPKKGLSLLNALFSKNEYQLAVVRQVCFFVIGNNWAVTQELFSEKLARGEIEKYFHNSRYNTDLGRFLKGLQQDFDSSIVDKLDEIISHPPNDTEYETAKYWQLRWYSALRKNVAFEDKHKELSKELKLDDDHFDTLGRTQVFCGERSPIEVDELLKMSNIEIIDYVTDFKPKRDFNTPSVYGLGSVLQTAVKSDPQRFSEGIHDFSSLPSIYIYHIYSGFYRAWEDRKDIHWENVITFMLQYVEDERFYANKLRIEEDNRADADWCIGIFSNLLQEGMENDGHCLDVGLLPKVKKLLMIFASHLKSENNGSNDDAVNASLNSTSGKILRALINYSLFNARKNLSNSEVKWESDVRDVFEKAFENKVIDSIVSFGIYYPQFIFLSTEWSENKLEFFQTLKGKYWKAFWSGYLFSNYIPNKEDYSKYLAHYRRAIKTDDNDERLNRGRITQHITSFYFFGYDDLNSSSLVNEFCEQANAPIISRFINYVGNQKDYLSLLKTEEEKVEFENKIITLWKFLIKRFEKQQDEEGRELLSELLDLLSLMSELNSKITELILVSSPIIANSYRLVSLLDNLLRLCNSGFSEITAKYAGKIIASLPVGSLPLYDNREVKDILVFLFENKQKDIANKFCDDKVRLGDESFSVLIDKYK